MRASAAAVIVLMLSKGTDAQITTTATTTGTMNATPDDASMCLTKFYNLFLACGNEESLCKGDCTNLVGQLSPYCGPNDVFTDENNNVRPILAPAEEADKFCNPCIQKFRVLTESMPHCMSLFCIGTAPPECTDVMQETRSVCSMDAVTWDFAGNGNPVRVHDYLMAQSWCSMAPPPHHPDEDLLVSGFHCMDGRNEHVNGLYRFKGHTADGRPYYAKDAGLVEAPRLWFYFDEACADGFPAAWFITDRRPDTSKWADLNSDDMGCPHYASIHKTAMPQFMDPKSPPLGGHLWTTAWCGDRLSTHRGMTVERVSGPGRCVELPFEKAMRLGVLPCQGAGY
mmetsp:Transcript_1365/g.3626  ORF Transcript_1365/g.3626 Transcript_1365/m.3626 type:complete len:340 (-) Transcript_1365:182-1201(-)